MDEGTVHRISYSAANQPPTARIAVTPTNGAAPLTVQFDGTGSFDPEGTPLSFAWDFCDSTTGTGATISQTHQAPGTYAAKLTVTDSGGATGTSTARITPGNGPPSVTMRVTVTDPATGATLTKYRVGDNINFTGSATDTTGKPLPASAYTWHLIINHLSHTHDGGSVTGVTSGKFTAPDHTYPCSLTAQLTALLHH